ncbi:Hypothetical protein Y17_3453 [Pectobacterium wasabiae CFBP 3304]|nr:Hypothetical protein Y17_3453 [Pectobacterium wasabiae CFBP 3304]
MLIYYEASLFGKYCTSVVVENKLYWKYMENIKDEKR